MNARVVYSGFQGAAGNYVVLRNKKVKRDYVYMHLQAPSPLLKGQKVVKGQFVGAVGDTGRATGCHLHFEIWKGKWYRGGYAARPDAQPAGLGLLLLRLQPEPATFALRPC